MWRVNPEERPNDVHTASVNRATKSFIAVSAETSDDLQIQLNGSERSIGRKYVCNLPTGKEGESEKYIYQESVSYTGKVSDWKRGNFGQNASRAISRYQLKKFGDRVKFCSYR